MSHRLPHLASQLQIEQWAATYEARAKMPNLVRRLIRATVPQVEELSMQGDEHVDLSGYDGVVTSPVRTPLVPLGRSVWEFGTSDPPQAKANKDYKKRTKDPLGVDRSATTFVFVTPRRWPGAAKWAEEKAALGEWKDVIVLTSADLYAALEESPRSHVWFSEQLGIPSNGVSTLASWWGRYTTGTKGLITPELLIAGRADVVAQVLREFIDTDSAHVWIKAPTTDDVLAFVTAAIMAAEPETRDGLLDRALVVFDPGALSYLDRTEGLLILVPFEESLMRQADLITGHHVVMHTTGGIEVAIELPPVPIREAEKVLEDAGVERGRIQPLSKALNKSLPLFKQQVTGVANLGLISSKTGVTNIQVARRSWLLGSWTFAQAGDVGVFTSFVGQTPESAQGDLERLADGAAPLLTHVNAAWKVFDPVASFAQIAPSITASDLQAMEQVVQEALGAVDPRLDVPREHRWRANIDGKIRAHSSDLRNGVARTIALLGAEGDGGTLVGGASLRGWAELAVRALLQRANEDSTGKLWGSLLDVIALLAEAAPDQFLQALEVATAPGGVLEGKIFEESDDFMSPTSPHVYILWALETLAWSPEYFGSAAMLIARLARLDPGGKLSNRPIASLTTIFMPWHPQTGASLKSRNRVLSRLCASHPEVAWELLRALLPEPHATLIQGSVPEFRAWKSDADAKAVTMASYFETVEHVLSLGLDMAAEDYSRLPDLVDKLDDLTPQLRARALEVFDAASTSVLSTELRDEIWKKLSALVRRHKHFRDSDWALDEDALAKLDATAGRFEPTNQLELVEWLFDHTPDLEGVDLRDDYDKYNDEVLRRQINAVGDVYQQSGFEGVLGLARKVVLPWSVGAAAAESPTVSIDLDTVASLIVDESDAIREFSASFIRRTLAGDTAALLGLAERHSQDSLTHARVLRLIDDLPVAWEAALSAGEDVDRHYWAEFRIFGRGEFELVNETAAQLRRHGRFARALDLMAIYSHNAKITLDAQLIVDLLNDLISSNDDPERAALSQYDIAALLDYVRNSGQIDTPTLGLLEWRLLPALDRSSSIAALQSLLASSPEFFVQIVSYVYRRGGSEAGEQKHPTNLVQNAWDLLHRWNVIPGATNEGGEVDESQLTEWVIATRELLTEADRLEAGESHIGQVFAYSKADGDLWPTLPVRNFLEESSSDVIDRSFAIGISNRRGVVSRSRGEGGDQERVLATKYDDYAALVRDEWPRTARLLRMVADQYRHEASYQDEQAQREQEGFER